MLNIWLNLGLLTDLLVFKGDWLTQDPNKRFKVLPTFTMPSARWCPFFCFLSLQEFYRNKRNKFLLLAYPGIEIKIKPYRRIVTLELKRFIFASFPVGPSTITFYHIHRKLLLPWELGHASQRPVPHTSSHCRWGHLRLFSTFRWYNILHQTPQA